MSNVLNNRIKSAHPRRMFRNDAEIPFSQRPTTSFGRPIQQQKRKSALNQAALKTLERPVLTPSSNRERAKTANVLNSLRSTAVPRRTLRGDEIESLLKSLDDDNPAIGEVECLADYQMLAGVIDLRRTPIDCQALCALQQRENRIVQKNAAKDIRFRSLLETLEPMHIKTVSLVETKPSDDDDLQTVITNYSITTSPY